MRLNPFSSNRHRVAPEPSSPASTDCTAPAETAMPQPLSQAPKRAATHSAATSHQAILASARKTFASLQKKLPSMHVRFSPPRPMQVSPTPTRYTTPVATPDRPPQTQTPQQRLDTRQQQPTPQAANPARAQRLQPQRTVPAPRPAPIKPAPIPAASPSQVTRPSLRSLNREIAQLSKECSAIKMRLYVEDGKPTAQEQRLFDTRAARIAQRNQVRDSQLDAMLHALAPLEHVRAPKTTTSRLASVQSNVIQYNRDALLEARRRLGDTPDIAKHYARAQRRLASLQESGAHHDQVGLLERMMKGYENLLDLEDMAKRTDDQLERMGGPRLMDSIPTTPQERRQRHQDEVDAHQEALDNGYL